MNINKSMCNDHETFSSALIPLFLGFQPIQQNSSDINSLGFLNFLFRSYYVEIPEKLALFESLKYRVLY